MSKHILSANNLKFAKSRQHLITMDSPNVNPYKLYYAPGACSLASHISLEMSKQKYELEKVEFPSHKLSDGTDYYKINPGGYVPALRLPNDEILLEGVAILSYIADKAPASNLAPAEGTMQRYRLLEKLGFISTEVHKGFSPLFGNPPPEVKSTIVKRLETRFQLINDWLSASGAGRYLLGEQFTVADAYLFTVMRWREKFGIDISAYPKLDAYLSRIEALPAVQAALRQEGLINA